MTSQLVDMMSRAALGDEFPDDEQCWRAFLFDRCRSEEDLTNLLGLYIGLFKLHPEYKKSELIQAIDSRQLASYLATLHNDHHQSYYSKWFVQNIERFQN